MARVCNILILKGNGIDFSCDMYFSVVCICKYGLNRLGSSILYMGQSPKHHTVYESVVAIVEQLQLFFTI